MANRLTGTGSSDGHAPAARFTPQFVTATVALTGLVAAVLVLFLAPLASSTPTPRDASAPAGEFSAGRVLPMLERLVGTGTPHPLGTAANAATRAQVIAELETIGLEPVTHTAFACMSEFAVCGEVSNVMARLPGREAGPAVLLTAHYDSVGAGPGVSDDLVGVAAIIETARLLLADGPLRNPFIVLVTDGEEAGLLGAEAFTHHEWFADVGAVVNVEARGSSGQSLMFETNVGNAWLIDAFARQAPRPATTSLLYEIYQLLPNDTDFSVYKRAGLNGMNFAYVGDVGHYHTPLDDLEHLDRGSLQHQGDNVLAAARALGAGDLLEPPRGNAIYIDLVPGSVLRAPASWATPLAAACLLAWLVLAVVLTRRRLLTAGRVLLGVVAALASVAVAAALGFGVASAVQALSGLPEPWYASPVPVRVAVWLAALFGAVAMAALFARRLGFWGLAVGAWLVWAALTLATAIALPGASIVFLVPTVTATVAFALAVLLGGARASGATVGMLPAAAAILATFATAYVWLPFAITVEAVMGMLLSAAVAFCLGLTLITLTPLLASDRARGTEQAASRRVALRGALLLGSIGGVVVAGFLALRAPLFSEQTPQRFSIWHVQDAAAGTGAGASWLLAREPQGPLPDTFATAGDFQSTPPATLPISSGDYLYAAAPPRPVAPPSVAILSDGVSNATRAIRLRLVAGTDRDWLTLSLPRSAGPARLLLPGTDYEIELVGAMSSTTGRAQFECHGAPCDGLEVELQLDRQEGFDLILQGNSYGLPDTAAALVAARPATAVPSHGGDGSMVFSSVSLPRLDSR